MGALEDAQEEVKPDMTPMIDVVFLMIIFFICIDFKVLESKLPAFLPKDKGSQATKEEPQEQLSIKIHVETEGNREYKSGGSDANTINPLTKRPYRFVLKNHRVRWEVGPTPVHTLEALAAELKRIAQNPASMVPDKETGGKKLMPCVIEAYPGTYYEDVAKTADACNEAQFKEINFGGGLGEKPRK